MIQLFLTLIIVIGAVVISLWKLIRYFRDPLRGCDGCGKACSGCPLEELKSKSDVSGAARRKRS